MSDAVSSQPFDDQPLRPGAGGGCGKPALVGCGVVALAALIALVVLVVRAQDLLAWSLGEYRDALLTHLPAEVTPAERERLEKGFEAVLTALEHGDLDPTGLPELQRVLLRTSSRVDRLERRDVQELIAALERAAGLSPPAAAPDPEPEPAATTAAA